MQPEYKNPSSIQSGTAPATEGSCLPGSAQVDIRTMRIEAGSARAILLPVDRSPSQPPHEPQYHPSITLPNLVISIIQQTQPSIGPSVVPAGGNGPTADPLLEALQRLAGYGILPTRDGLVPPVRDISSLRVHSASSLNKTPDSALSSRATDPMAHTTQAVMPRAERASGAGHAEGQPKQEPLSEEKTRQILENALASFYERRGDRAPAPDPKLTAPLSPERPGGERTLDRGVELRMKDPAIDMPLAPSVRNTLNDPRNDTARLMQQLLTGDLHHGRQLAAPSSGVANTDRSVWHHAEPALMAVRGGINEGISHIRDALQTTIERASPRPPSSPTQAETVIAQSTKPGDFTQIEPVRHHQAPALTIQGADRTAPRSPHESINPSLSPIAREGIGISLSSPGALRPAGHPSPERSTTPLDTGSALLDAIARAAERSLSLQTLRKIDQALETAVISAAAAVALGVIGGDIVLKEILALGKDILGRLRPRTDPKEKHEEEIKEIRDLVEELEKICSDRDVETIDQPAEFVADITGTIRHHDTDLPLEGIEVDGGSLGVTHTNARGEFIFKNVPLDTGFVVYARSAEYTFFPHPAQGTVSAMTNLSIFGRKV